MEAERLHSGELWSALVTVNYMDFVSLQGDESTLLLTGDMPDMQRLCLQGLSSAVVCKVTWS